MAVSKRLRYEVLRRDNHQCRYCGATAPDVRLTVDHVLPSTLGGTDEASNLVTACADCNSGKSASTPDAALVEDVSQDQVRWGRAMALAVEQRAAELAADRQRVARFDEAWLSWTYSGDVQIMRPSDWKASVLHFMAAGLDDEFLADAIETAAGNPKLRNKDVWRYFCGICWREVKKIQSAAKVIVGKPETSAGRRPLSVHFDQLNLADYFLTSVTHLYLGLDDPLVEEMDTIISRAFWEAMSTAYAQFSTDEEAGTASDRPDVLEALREAAMPHLMEAHRALDRAVSAHGTE